MAEGIIFESCAVNQTLNTNISRSKLTYTPLNNKDYGTLMCSATNEVGRQRNPCIFHIILAGIFEIGFEIDKL